MECKVDVNTIAKLTKSSKVTFFFPGKIKNDIKKDLIYIEVYFSNERYSTIINQNMEH
jgi:hypothetical protein